MFPLSSAFSMPDLRVLYEDNHLLVVDKPAGIATMGAEPGEPSVHALAADYLRRKYHKPGGVFVGIVSRLDAMTSGVLVLARTSKAASRLAPQFAPRSAAAAAAGNPAAASKLYLAAVEGGWPESSGELIDQVRKDDAARRMRVVGPSVGDGARAHLRFVTLGGDDAVSLLAVQLLSGRKHQIRVQFSDRGHPVVGDRKYGSTQPFASGIALHSWRLRVDHPTRREPMWWEAPPPKSWNRFGPVLPDRDRIRQWTDASFGMSD